MTSSREWTIYECPGCGWSSLSKGAFTSGKCIRCLKFCIRPKETRVAEKVEHEWHQSVWPHLEQTGEPDVA